jgi:hypothetical protein
MFFYDAFSFIQVTFMLFIVLGLGMSALLSPQPAYAAQRLRREAPQPPLTPNFGSPQPG